MGYKHIDIEYYDIRYAADRTLFGVVQKCVIYGSSHLHDVLSVVFFMHEQLSTYACKLSTTCSTLSMYYVLSHYESDWGQLL